MRRRRRRGPILSGGLDLVRELASAGVVEPMTAREAVALVADLERIGALIPAADRRRRGPRTRRPWRHCAGGRS